MNSSSAVVIVVVVVVVIVTCMIEGFRPDVDEMCDLLGY